MKDLCAEISIREYAAIQILAGMGCKTPSSTEAFWAVKGADALLKELEKTKSENE